MGDWRQNHKIENVALKSETQLYKDALSEIELDKMLEDVANSKYMFSDVIYHDEFDNAFKPNLSSNRSYETMFFECYMKDGIVEYHSGESVEQVLAKFAGIKMLRQIKQEEYEILREKQSHLY